MSDDPSARSVAFGALLDDGRSRSACDNIQKESAIQRDAMLRWRSRTPLRRNDGLVTDDVQSPLKSSRHSTLMRKMRAMRQQAAKQCDKRRISDLEAQVTANKRSQYIVVEKIVEKVVEVPVEKVVEAPLGKASASSSAEDWDEMVAAAKVEISEQMKKEHGEQMLQIFEGLQKSEISLKAYDATVKQQAAEINALRADAENLRSLNKSLMQRQPAEVKSALPAISENLEQRILDLQNQVLQLQDYIDNAGDSPSCSDDVDSHVSFDDDVFNNPMRAVDEAVAEKIALIERLRCPVHSKCDNVMSHSCCGPDFNGQLACQQCNLDLTCRGKYGRQSRECTKHGHLCLDCAFLALKRQVNDTG